jgi:hypothetical protein
LLHTQTLLPTHNNMTQTIKSDPNDQSLFSNKGVKELIPPFNFDHRTHKIEVEEVEDVIQRVTDCMVNLSASDPRFLYTRKFSSRVFLISVADGRVIDSTKWEFWEWPQAIGLNGLLDVGPFEEQVLIDSITFIHRPSIQAVQQR